MWATECSGVYAVPPLSVLLPTLVPPRVRKPEPAPEALHSQEKSQSPRVHLLSQSVKAQL